MCSAAFARGDVGLFLEVGVSLVTTDRATVSTLEMLRREPHHVNGSLRHLIDDARTVVALCSGWASSLEGRTHSALRRTDGMENGSPL